MANEGFSRAAIEETQQLIETPCAEVRDERKRRVVFPGNNMGKAAIERHPGMVWENETDGGLLCANDTAKNPPTWWRRKCCGVPPSRLAPPKPRTPPAPPDDSEETSSSETEGVPPKYLYIHTPLPNTRYFNLHPYAQDRMRDEDFTPDLLTDEGPSTG